MLRHSPDSGQPWAEPGAWPVAPGVHRLPLPLPMDGLRAVNVYVLETDEGLTLIDGGWAVEAGRAALDRGLAELGHTAAEITRFLVTHVHRDHYTLAVAVRREFGSRVALGLREKATLDLAVSPRPAGPGALLTLLNQSGAADLAERWADTFDGPGPDPADWTYPDEWLDGDVDVTLGDRTLLAVETPGHTRGHYVFADREAGLLFAGDHVLPTITPSIGFEPAPAALPLADFLTSLRKVRGMPDAVLLPAHGPVAPSVHARVDELLAHHEHRLSACRDAVRGAGHTAYEVAGVLPWTRRERAFTELGLFDQALAVLETRAHLELLVVRAEAVATAGEVPVYSAR